MQAAVGPFMAGVLAPPEYNLFQIRVLPIHAGFLWTSHVRSPERKARAQGANGQFIWEARSREGCQGVLQVSRNRIVADTATEREYWVSAIMFGH